MGQDDKHLYEIDLKQGDLFIQLSSDDVNFISKQMERWFQILLDDSYVPIAIPPTPVVDVTPAPDIVKAPAPAPPESPAPETPPPPVEPKQSQAGNAYEQALLEQIKQLQEQVQQLTIQTLESQQQLKNLAVSAPLQVQPEPQQPAPSPAEPPPEPEPVLPVSAQEEAPTPSDAEMPPVVETVTPAEIDAFSTPAHQDVQAGFEAFQSAQPEDIQDRFDAFHARRPEDVQARFDAFHATRTQFTEASSGFEQPVQNPPQPVENMTAQPVDFQPETGGQTDIQPETGAFAQPVQNTVATLTEPVAPFSPEAGDSSGNNLDALLDSLASDLEGVVTETPQDDFLAGLETALSGSATPAHASGAQEIPPTPATTMDDAFSAPAGEPAPAFDEGFPQPVEESAFGGSPPEQQSLGFVQEETGESAPFPDHSTVQAEPEPAASTDFDFPSLDSAFSSDPSEQPAPDSAFAPAQLDLDAEINKIDVDLPASPIADMEPFPPMTPGGYPEPAPDMKMDSSESASESMENELTALFGEPQTPSSPAQDESAAFEQSVREFERPQINYDFGIPAPEPTNDPRIKQLSLEVLQGADNEYESPFPDPDAEEESYDEGEGAAAFDNTSFQTTPTTADDLMQIESLQELCELAPNATSGADFLILAAYFLSTIKQMEKYALKDLNAQLVRSGLTPINHGILEGAIAKGHMQLVPDLTGTATAAEYTLTDSGFAHAKSLVTL